jgi:hypothetical protein
MEADPSYQAALQCVMGIGEMEGLPSNRDQPLNYYVYYTLITRRSCEFYALSLKLAQNEQNKSKCQELKLSLS